MYKIIKNNNITKIDITQYISKKERSAVISFHVEHLDA